MSHKTDPQPKESYSDPTPLDEALGNLNHFQMAADQAGNTTSRLILQEHAYEEQRKLLHEQGVIPVISEVGCWDLFDREDRPVFRDRRHQ